MTPQQMMPPDDLIQQWGQDYDRMIAINPNHGMLSRTQYKFHKAAEWGAAQQRKVDANICVSLGYHEAAECAEAIRAQPPLSGEE